MSVATDTTNRLRSLAGGREALESRVDSTRDRADASRAEAVRVRAILDVLAAVQEAMSTDVERAFGSVVSHGLSKVFDEPLKFIVDLGFRGDVPTASFRIRDASGLETDVIDSRGGGLVNVAAFLLNVRLLLAVRPPLARVLCLDEAFANVHVGRLGRVVDLLIEICDRGAFQMIVVSQIPQLAELLLERAPQIGIAYEADQVNGETRMTRLQ